jgi:branched-chain amino acid aminotransferase
MKIYIDGVLYPESEAKISVFDHGLLYGDGIFEGIRFYNGRVFRLEEHLERLWDSAKAIRLKIPITVDEMREATLETIRQNHLEDGYIRLLVTRGKGNLGLSPDRCPKATVIIIVDKIQLYPVEKYAQGMVMVTCATRRAAPAALLPAVKSLNYLNNVMAKVEATHAGADEGVMLNEQGYVAECTGDNIFVIRKGVVTTPPVYAGALCGITRTVVFEICQDLGVPIRESEMTRYDIYTADECFLTGTAAEVIAAIELDTRPIGDGKPGVITGRIIARFREIAGSTGTPIHG